MSTSTSAEAANRKMERADLAILEALEKAPEHTMRWDDRFEDGTEAPLPGSPKGTPPRRIKRVVEGLETTVNRWCDEHAHLTVIAKADVTVKFKNGQSETYTPDPYIQRCTISRVADLVQGGVIDHLMPDGSSPDETTATKGTRELRLNKAGVQILAHFRANKYREQGLPWPDPKAPVPVEPDLPKKAEAEKKGEEKKQGAAA